MDFRTIVKIPSYSFTISYTDKILLFGSCFAEHIGNKLLEHKFDVNINPFGILYNPMSINSALNDLLNKKIYTEKDLLQQNDIFHSFSHHSRFSSTDMKTCLNTINESLEKAYNDLQNSNFLLITFGTAYVYYLKENNSVVSNCHKLSEKLFIRKRLNINNIVENYTILINKLKAINPSLNIIFTVSPIRHWKDGAHNNQLSKSILLLAIEQLQEEFENVNYFPSYEIIMDELRDYRFYADDMLHISDFAISYIWKQFSASLLSTETQEKMQQWEKIRKALTHKPFNQNSKEYQLFIQKNIEILNNLKTLYPNLDIDKELVEFNHRLTDL